MGLKLLWHGFQDAFFGRLGAVAQGFLRAKALILAEGKPENMVEKIAQGKLNKFFKDNTLLPQIFVKDSAKTVAQYLDSVSKGLTVVEFKRVSIG